MTFRTLPRNSCPSFHIYRLCCAVTLENTVVSEYDLPSLPMTISSRGPGSGWPSPALGDRCRWTLTSSLSPSPSMTTLATTTVTTFLRRLCPSLQDIEEQSCRRTVDSDRVGRAEFYNARDSGFISLCKLSCRISNLLVYLKRDRSEPGYKCGPRHLPETQLLTLIQVCWQLLFHFTVHPKSGWIILACK